MIEIYNGGPGRFRTPCLQILGKKWIRLKHMVEPFLLKEGFIQRTPRGRVATAKAYQHFNIPLNENEIN